MKITIESQFTLSNEDRKTINSKISYLSKYEARISQVNVYFKRNDRKGPNSILSEIQVRVPGNDLFSEGTDEDAVKAFSIAYNSIKRATKKRRGKMNEHYSPIKEIRDIVNDNN